MSRVRLAYMPLVTYPDPVPEQSVVAAVSLAAALGFALEVTTFAAVIPPVAASLGDLLLSVPEMIRKTEENSRAHCAALQDLVGRHADGAIRVACNTRDAAPGVTGDLAAAEARYRDLSLLPWAKGRPFVNELAQSVVFGSGHPAILVPPTRGTAPIRHVAIAWDGSRVAARAVADVLSLVNQDTRLTVLTVRGEKALDEPDIAQALASSLGQRGYAAKVQSVALDRRPIAQALQDTALELEADLLAMGGFGHSRLRDFILGGATQGVFADLRLAVLLSH